MRSYTSVPRTSTQNAQKPQSKADILDSSPRPNVRKDGYASVNSSATKAKSEIEVNPNSPFLQEVHFEGNSENQKEAMDEIKSLRIEKTAKKKKEEIEDFSQNLPDTDSNNDEQNQVDNEEYGKSPLKLSKESNEKLSALKKSLIESEESKNTYFVVKDSNTKENAIYSDTKNYSREERLALANQKNYAHSSAWQWTLTLRPASVITGITVLCITLGFFFLFGLIVGRGLTPASEPLPLVSIVPTEDESLLTEDAPILQAEELGYASALKKPDEIVPVPLDPNASAQTAGQAGTTPYPIGEGASAVEGEVVPEAEPVLQIFEYTLRVASLKNSKDADALKARLERDGLRSTVTRSGSWYSVNVLFLGQESSFEEMRKSLTKYGIKDSIITDKKALKLD